MLVPIFEDDQPQLRDREQRRAASDRPGRVNESHERMRHAMEPQTSNTERVREQYAHEVLERLQAEAAERHFDHLVLVAPPQMLGTLRQLLDDQLRARVVGELAKDLAGVPVHDLPDHLGAWLGRGSGQSSEG
jgi:protein required for attachment to host cells